MSKNEKFDIRGINHLALVCKDMEKTVEFYTEILGMPLIKTIELPNNMGQHFFLRYRKGRFPRIFLVSRRTEQSTGSQSPNLNSRQRLNYVCSRLNESCCV